MKKLLMALAAALITVAAVSAESPKIYVDGGITVPVWGNLDCGSGVESQTLVSVGTDISFRAMFTDVIGFYANAGFYWPQESKVENKYSSDTTIKASDMDEWWGFNAFAGVALMPVHGEKIGLTIAPGFAFITNEASNKLAGKTVTQEMKLFGAGVNVGLDIYLTEKFYLKPIIESVVTFAGDTDGDSSKSWFTCKPAFAVGWRF